MRSPKVSIIMGIFNCERYLGDAIESILSQTFSDWEFIMCDDGSSDRTLQIAEKYKLKYPKKFVILKNEKNMGLNYTLNKCLAVANGEYIARMDGDDICAPTRLEKEVIFLENHPEFALVSTEMVMFDELGDWGIKKVIERPSKNDFCRHTPFFCHAAVMIRKRVFQEVEGYTVDPKLLRVEDCHLWFKIYGRGYVGANISEPLYKMRDDRNATNRRTFKARMNGIYVMWIGFHLLQMPWYKYWYVLRGAVLELVKCIIPLSVYEFLHKRKFDRSVSNE
ncbi:glycosyltransferase [Dorea acetigenes]|uniref:Glycosyltransferase n=1 Tax=Dorea acetigenes TaxID=2981787 RepID=A0ABT2RMY5_9FIRM|nr:glycosyltransferase [Dorea acetigenes]MCU6686755.1 glycosyltransferase [Dorea acetigenes]SCJ09541.1 Spore coat polysaccharide biosynthesis protein spsA [uncultured Clostridium sp.]